MKIICSDLIFTFRSLLKTLNSVRSNIHPQLSQLKHFYADKAARSSGLFAIRPQSGDFGVCMKKPVRSSLGAVLQDDTAAKNQGVLLHGH